MSWEAVVVKEEPSWSVSALECGVSEAAARAGLYAGHELKEELVIGPECLQPPDGSYALYEVTVKEECDPALTDWCVKLDEAVLTIPTAQHQSQDTPAEHTTTPHTNTHYEYICHTCGKICRLKQNLIKHVQLHLKNNSNTIKKRYTCEICGTQFTYLSNCRRHKRKHKGVKPFKCNICNKQYLRSEHLKAHKKSHTGERPYACDMCDMRFLRIDHCNAHKLTHTGDKPFICDICNRRFSRLGNLNAHVRTHTGDRPFPCEICGKRFAHACNLKNHLNIHANIKPYFCEICDKRFTQRSQYTSHKLSHSSETPFECKFCGKRFKRLKSLRSHSQSHNGENTDDD